MIRFSTLALLLLLLFGGLLSDGCADEPPAKAVADAAQIEAWVKQLDSDLYAERQAAMLRLKDSGTAGVAAIAKIARGSNPEVTARAINLLAVMYDSADPDVGIAADEALESLGQQGPPIAAVRTQEVLSTTLGPQRRRHAIAAIRRLGGHVIPQLKWDDEGVNEIEADLNEEGTVQHVVLGKKWTGGLNGVKYLNRIPELRSVNITTAVSLTREELVTLRAMLPATTRIDFRGSAFMGVKSQNQDLDVCVIDSVVPNSPAKRGGLKPGDIITHVEGLPIQGFEGLTSALQSREGGETVFLEVRRQEQTLELSVVLGEW